ncbi:hypothetical protein QUF64_06745 [Anaerolineales bacterium HSG6]|nr:hypothetical protein [Anaerolineales bacterium HSG6]MDM8531194.1 hypothetical protein [Anaerolineales bacterium HSG25]
MLAKRLNVYIKVTVFLLIAITLIWWGLVINTDALAAPVAQGQDIAAINTPTSGPVQGRIQLIGSADHPTFEFYVIDVSPEGIDGWQFLADGRSPVINGALGSWDTTTLPDGAYKLRLRVVRIDGNYSEAFVQQVLVNNSQPLPTNTPSLLITPTTTAEFSLPDIPTATSVPPTPTPEVTIEQPIVDTPTPRPSETPTGPSLEPTEQSIIPKITNFSTVPLIDAFLYGAGLMLGLFLLFGFFSALRMVIQGFIDRRKKRKYRS